MGQKQMSKISEEMENDVRKSRMQRETDKTIGVGPAQIGLPILSVFSERKSNGITRDQMKETRRLGQR